MTIDTFGVLLAGIAAAVTAIWAIVAHTSEWKHTRFIKGIELLDKYADKFSAEYRASRRVAAEYLLSKSFDPENAPEALYDIIDFFDSIAYLNRRGICDNESCWYFFASWLLPYIAAANPVLSFARKDDPSLWEDVPLLYAALEEIEKKRHPSRGAFHIVSPTEIEKFLRGEIS